MPQALRRKELGLDRELSQPMHEMHDIYYVMSVENKMCKIKFYSIY